MRIFVQYIIYILATSDNTSNTHILNFRERNNPQGQGRLISRVPLYTFRKQRIFMRSWFICKFVFISNVYLFWECLRGAICRGERLIQMIYKFFIAFDTRRSSNARQKGNSIKFWLTLFIQLQNRWIASVCIYLCIICTSCECLLLSAPL